MAWNGSDKKVEKVGGGGERNGRFHSSTSTSTSSFNYKALCAGLIVILIGGLAAWFVLGRARTPAAPHEHANVKASKIPTVAPAKAEPTEEPEQQELTADEKRLQKIAEIEKRWEGKKMPLGIKTELYYLKRPAKKTITVKVPFAYLRHTSERDIAGVGLAQPGAFFLIQPEYGESFDNDFTSALVDRIESDPNDTDEVRETKQAVEAMKKEIAKICREEGKKPSEIMNEHAKALYELGRYKEDLERELDKVRMNPDVSDEDVMDFFTAANAMLKKKGLDEMKVPNLTRRSLYFQLKNKKTSSKGTVE